MHHPTTTPTSTGAAPRRRQPSQHCSPFRRLVADVRARSAGAGGRRAVERFAAAGVPVGGCATPFALACSCHGRVDPERATAAVAGLLSLGAGDEDAVVCTLVALLPALTAMARFRRSHGEDATGAESAVLAAAWGAVASSAPRSASELVRAAWATVRAETRAERRRSRPTGPVHPTAAQPDTSTSGPELGVLLAQARAAGALSAERERVLIAAYVDDQSDAMIARATGRRAHAVTVMRLRAEAALASFVAGGQR